MLGTALFVSIAFTSTEDIYSADYKKYYINVLESIFVLTIFLSRKLIRPTCILLFTSFRDGKGYVSSLHFFPLLYQSLILDCLILLKPWKEAFESVWKTAT